ncbi:hypothetical protein [Tabrizicola soli]|uniref:Uncharacterized protein n=1 Tax=Tabrizicola soli TaxID=2185115 RepID=A0ABV7E2J9_9RHOB|nr:hypothetical protein [Tabrizicola soli]
MRRQLGQALRPPHDAQQAFGLRRVQAEGRARLPEPGAAKGRKPADPGDDLVQLIQLVALRP